MPVATLLFAAVALASPMPGAVYSGGFGSATGRPHQNVYQTPGLVEDLGPVIDFTAGLNHGVSLRPDGSVVAWGDNLECQLGQGASRVASSKPLLVAGLPRTVAIAAGALHTLALTEAGEVYAWGTNAFRALGPGTTSKRTGTPVKVTGLSGIVAVAAGSNYSLALKSDGTVWAWGGNNFSQLGVTGVTERATPAAVAGLSGIAQVSAGYVRAYAVKTDGTAWGWGENSSQQLGVGAPEAVVVQPKQVLGLDLVRKISAGNGFALALRDDRTVFSWGRNDAGQLGLPTAPLTWQGTNKPLRVRNLGEISEIAAGHGLSIAIDTAGKLFMSGQLSGFRSENSPKFVPIAGIDKSRRANCGQYFALILSDTEFPIWAEASPSSIVAGHGTTSLLVHTEKVFSTDVVVKLTSNFAKAPVPATVTLPAGQSVVEAPIGVTKPVPEYREVRFTASAGATVSTALLYLQKRTATVLFNPDIVQAGDTANSSVQINYKAPAGGVKFTLATDMPSRVKFPATVTVLEGESSVGFYTETTPSLTGAVPKITATGPVVTDNVFAIRGNGLGSIRFDVPEAYGGIERTLIMRLPQPAGAGGVVVHLLQGGNEFTMPSECQFAQGEIEKSVKVGVPTVPTVASLPITAYVQDSYPKVAWLKVLAAELKEITTDKPAIVGGESLNVTVTLTSPSSGQEVKLTTTDPSVTLQPSLTFSAGQVSRTIVATSTEVTQPKLVHLIGTLGKSNFHFYLPVRPKPPKLTGFTIAPDQATGGTWVTLTVTLAGAAPTGGAYVALRASKPGLLDMPTEIRVTPGKSTLSYQVKTSTVAAVTDLTITATLLDVQLQKPLKIKP